MTTQPTQDAYYMTCSCGGVMGIYAQHDDHAMRLLESHTRDHAYVMQEQVICQLYRGDNPTDPVKDRLVGVYCVPPAKKGPSKKGGYYI